MAKSGKPRKLNNRQIDVAIAMRRERATLKNIAERLGCSISLVSRTLKAAEEGGVNIPRARKGRKRKSDKSAKGIAAAEGQLPSTVERTLEELTDDLEQLNRRKREALESWEVKDLMDLIKAIDAIIALIQARTPPPVPDPEEDPANVEARNSVRERLAYLVTRSEQENAA